MSDHVPLAWTPSVMFYTPTTRGQGELQVKHWERQERTGAEAASGCGAEGVRWWGLKWETENGFTEGWCMSLVWKGSHDLHVAGGQGNGRSDVRDSTKHGGREDYEDINECLAVRERGWRSKLSPSVGQGRAQMLLFSKATKMIGGFQRLGIMYYIKLPISL